MRGELEAKMAELAQETDAKCEKLTNAAEMSAESLAAAERMFSAQLQTLQDELREVTEHRLHSQLLVDNIENKYLVSEGAGDRTVKTAGLGARGRWFGSC